MDKSFLKASAEIGRNFNLIQGAGGNTSYKEGDSLFIKASGYKLKDSLKSHVKRSTFSVCIFLLITT